MSTEQLPPLPEPRVLPPLIVNGKPSHVFGFTAEQVREAQRAAVAAYRARGEGGVAAWQAREWFSDEPEDEAWSKWREVQASELETWQKRVARRPDLYELRPLCTSPTAPDASQAERAYDAALHNHNSAFGWQGDAPGAYEAAAKAHRQRGIEAVRAALQSEAARGRG